MNYNSGFKLRNSVPDNNTEFGAGKKGMRNTQNTTGAFPAAGGAAADSSDPKNITQNVLRKCNVIRAKNLSVQPLRAGNGYTRLIQTRAENRNIRDLQQIDYSKKSIDACSLKTGGLSIYK